MSELTPGEKTGIKTVLQEEKPELDRVPGAAPAQARLPLCEVGGAEIDAEPDPAPRGVGRPKGARNKSTQEWREYLLSRYPSPLIALAEVMSRPTAQLAEELGFIVNKPAGRKARPEELTELLKIQLQAAKELLPYIHQKQPQAIEAKGDGIMQLIIQPLAATMQQADDAGEMSVNFIDGEIIENQGFSGEESGEFDAQEFDADGKPLEYNENSGGNV